MHMIIKGSKMAAGAHRPSTRAHAVPSASDLPPMKRATKTVHGGERAGRPQVKDSLTTPIVQTSTYWFSTTADLIDYNEGRLESYEYGRYGWCPSIA